MIRIDSLRDVQRLRVAIQADPRRARIATAHAARQAEARVAGHMVATAPDRERRKPEKR